jgi:hypothetical protein
MKKPKWQEDYDKVLAEMTDLQLFEEAFDAQNADDYDGGFTTQGSYCANKSREVLKERFERLINGTTATKL